jgi:hypothetical protein
MYKTAIAAALVIAALGGAATAINAAGSPSGNSVISGDGHAETHRSVPAIYSRPPWIKRHKAR